MATTRPKNGSTSGKQAKQRPVFTRKFFPVQVAVFEHEHEGRVNHSVSLSRAFRRDEESEWETTPYLSVADLLPAAKLLAEAYSVIQARLQRAYAEGHGTDAADDDQDIPF